jgi:hypothetical protein
MYRVLEVLEKDLISYNPIYYETIYGNIIIKKFSKDEYLYSSYIKSNNKIYIIIDSLENDKKLNSLISYLELKILISIELYKQNIGYYSVDYKFINNTIIIINENIIPYIETYLEKYNIKIINIKYFPNKQKFEYIKIILL